MTTNLYKVASGDLPLASDVDQYADMLNGVNDVGTITFAPQISAPTVTSVTATAATGTALGVGTYTYVFTYVVGYKKTNGTYIFGGETNASSTVTVTTTSGNQAVTLGSLPTSWPSTAVGLRIYRTAVGGSTYKLVATLTTPSATYNDTTADGSLGASVPTTNTTGTSIGGYVQTVDPAYSQLASGGAVQTRLSPNLVVNSGFENATTTAAVFSDALTIYTGSTVPAPWTLQSGSFTFGASGATSGATGALMKAGNSAWKPLVGSGSQNLALTAQATFTTPSGFTSTSQITLLLQESSTNQYIVQSGWASSSNTITLGKNVAGTYTQLAQVAYTWAASTTYTITLSIDHNGNLTAKLYSGTGTGGTLLQTLPATDTSLTGGFLIGVGGDTGVVISNASVTAPWANVWTIGGDSRVAWGLTQSAIGGKYSVSAVGVGVGAEGYLTQNITVSASTSYTLSAYIGTSNEGANGFKLELDANGAFVAKTPLITGTTSTTRQYGSGTTSSSQTTGTLYVIQYDSGTVVFDNIQLEQGSTATPYIPKDTQYVQTGLHVSGALQSGVNTQDDGNGNAKVSGVSTLSGGIDAGNGGGVVKVTSGGTGATDGAYIEYVPPVTGNTAKELNVTGANGTELDTFNILAKTIGFNGGNGSFVKQQNYELDMDSRTTNLTYTNGQLTQVQVVDPSNANAVVSTITLTYTSGQLISVREVADGNTVTTTLNYTNGQLSSVTKAVQ